MGSVAWQDCFKQMERLSASGRTIKYLVFGSLRCNSVGCAICCVAIALFVSWRIGLNGNRSFNARVMRLQLFFWLFDVIKYPLYNLRVFGMVESINRCPVGIKVYRFALEGLVPFDD